MFVLVYIVPHVDTDIHALRGHFRSPSLVQPSLNSTGIYDENQRKTGEGQSG